MKSAPAQVPRKPQVAGDKELTVVRTTGPKAGRTATYSQDDVERTGRAMLPAQIEEMRKGVPAARG